MQSDKKREKEGEDRRKEESKKGGGDVREGRREGGEWMGKGEGGRLQRLRSRPRHGRQRFGNQQTRI